VFSTSVVHINTTDFQTCKRTCRLKQAIFHHKIILHCPQSIYPFNMDSHHYQPTNLVFHLSGNQVKVSPPTFSKLKYYFKIPVLSHFSNNLNKSIPGIARSTSVEFYLSVSNLSVYFQSFGE